MPQRDAFELARVLLADADERRAAELDADPRTWRPDPDELDEQGPRHPAGGNE